MLVSNSEVLANLEEGSCIPTSKINNGVSSVTDGGDMLIDSYKVY